MTEISNSELLTRYKDELPDRRSRAIQMQRLFSDINAAGHVEALIPEGFKYDSRNIAGSLGELAMSSFEAAEDEGLLKPRFYKDPSSVETLMAAAESHITRPEIELVPEKDAKIIIEMLTDSPRRSDNNTANFLTVGWFSLVKPEETRDAILEDNFSL